MTSRASANATPPPAPATGVSPAAAALSRSRPERVPHSSSAGRCRSSKKESVYAGWRSMKPKVWRTGRTKQNATGWFQSTPIPPQLAVMGLQSPGVPAVSSIQSAPMRQKGLSGISSGLMGRNSGVMVTLAAVRRSRGIECWLYYTRGGPLPGDPAKRGAILPGRREPRAIIRFTLGSYDENPIGGAS